MAFFGKEYSLVKDENFDGFLRSSVATQGTSLVSDIMAFYGVLYTLEKDDNFDNFLRQVGVPEEKIAAFVSFKPTVKVTKNGDSYTITSSSPTGPKESTFKSGVEQDDVVGDDTAVKSTYTVDGNTITQVIKSPAGSATFKREFNGNELVVTITSDKFDGVAKRYYKA